MNTKEMYDALTAMVELFEGWRNGVFHTLGVVWQDEPRAIKAARLAIDNCDAMRCTGDQLTCPVAHDHP